MFHVHKVSNKNYKLVTIDHFASSSVKSQTWTAKTRPGLRCDNCLGHAAGDDRFALETPRKKFRSISNFLIYISHNCTIWRLIKNAAARPTR